MAKASVAVSPLEEGRRLLRELNAAEAIAAVDGASSSTDALLVRARAATMLERYDAAYQVFGALSQRREVSERQLADLRIGRAALLRQSSSSFDEALDLSSRGAALAERAGDAGLAAEGHLDAARAFAKKRARDLADDRIKRALAAKPNDPHVIAAEADILVAFDERSLALERYAVARTLGSMGERLGRGGAANVAFLLGQFEEAFQHLAALTPPRSGEVMVRRLRARLLLAQQRWPEAVYAFDEVLARGTGSERASMDKYERAGALYRAGWFLHAKTAYEEMAINPDKSRYVDLAKRHAKLLARPDVAQRRWARLVAFPTVAQLRSHCGPAACELYLRYFGIPASQVEVARQIKEPDAGTSIYKMRRFLENAGFHTRRVEAELPLLKRLVDAQVPVIMEEDYVATGHVAVAIGYDDVRELLEVQDPMSHEIRETCYEDLAELRELSNHGALVAVPKWDSARMAALDRIGAVECRYMSLVDEAWASLDAGRPEEGDRLALESQALRRDYEMGWFFRFQRVISRFEREPTGDNRLAMHAVVAEVRALWPDEDWPEQLQGEALMADGRYSEAEGAFKRARDREPRDPRTWTSLGVCEMALGRDDSAYDSFQQALRRDPAHRTANGRLAWLALDRGEIDRAFTLNAVARRLAPKHPLNHWIHGRVLAKKKQYAEAVAAFDRSIAIDKMKSAPHLDRARSLAALGKIDDASRDLLSATIELKSGRTIPLERAKLLFGHGRAAEAVTAARAIVVADPADADANAVLGAALLATGAEEEGTAKLRSAMKLKPTDPYAYVELGRHLRKTKEPARAVEAFATALGLAGPDARREVELGFALAEAGHGGEAARYLTKGGARGDLDEAALVRIGEILVDAGKAAKPFFDEVLLARPEDPAVMRAFVRIMLELCWAPSAGQPVLARLARAVPDDPYSLAHRGAEAMDRGIDTEADGEKLLRDAIARAPTREFPRRALAERFVARGRHEEAIEALAPCETRHQVMRARVRALLGLGRVDEAKQEITRFDAKWGKTGKESYGARTLRYEVLLSGAEYAAALAVAEELAKMDGERDDDGRLDPWETNKFECLARLREDERALRFGERQALDGPSLARLTLLAHEAGRPTLAQSMAERALRLVPDHMAAKFVLARAAELRGSDAEAQKAFQDLARRDSSWHRPHVAIARLAMGRADPLAGAAAELAVRAGPTYAETFGVRAQLRLLNGDRRGALADAERAYRMARPDQRHRELADVSALRAQLYGDRTNAAAYYSRHAEGPISALDRARIQRLIACG
ncbi:hypothetical protein BH09MYX1_BH09MYX1_20950 [soil metagenome]